MNLNETGRSTPKSQSLRKALDALLQRVWLQTIVVTMVVVNLFVISGLLLLALGFIRGSDEGIVTRVEQGLHYFHLGLLSLWLFELLLRIVARGVTIVEDKAQVFDGFVILIALALYLALTLAVERRVLACACAYVVSLRLWRMARIYSTILNSARAQSQQLLANYHKAWRLSEHNASVLRSGLLNTQHEMEVLRAQVAALRKARGAASYVNSPNSSQSLFPVGSACDVTTQVQLEAVLSGSKAARTDPPLRVPDLVEDTQTDNSLASLPSNPVASYGEFRRDVIASRSFSKAARLTEFRRHIASRRSFDKGSRRRLVSPRLAQAHSCSEVDSDHVATRVVNKGHLTHNNKDGGGGRKNDAYIEENYFTSTELDEIKRISQVPFEAYGSVTILKKTGVTITDL